MNVARASLLLVSLLCAAIPALADSPAVLEACVNSGNGMMRLVAHDVACLPKETRVQWNVTGPAGPAGPPGADGADAAGGPPYIWACTPINYSNAGSTNARLHVFNASASTANVAVHFLNKDGANLQGHVVPGAVPPNPGDPAPVYPGQSGAATVPVAASNTLIVSWYTAMGVVADGGDIPATLRVVSDQPVAVGAEVVFSGFNAIPCSLVPK